VNCETQQALEEVHRSFAELSRLLDRAVDDAMDVGAADLVKLLVAVNGKVATGAALVAELHQRLL
jgi:hypothetical protein